MSICKKVGAHLSALCEIISPEYREIAADSVQKTFLKALEEYDRLKDVSYIEP